MLLGALAHLALLQAGPIPEAYGVQVVDRATGRGVPLVELETVNHLLFVTDSAGWAAIAEPDLMGERVWFFVRSHGYEYPADGFGYRGARLEVEPGGRARLELDRRNLAERLYRVTGAGIYRDSLLLGEPAPTARPLLNGGVLGQDSVLSAVYRGEVFWIWGDTSRAAYPLGNFQASGARSTLPADGGLDPSVGVDLRYYVGEDGFSREMCPMQAPGPVWLDGLAALPDPAGEERLVARFMRVKSLGELYEQGFVVWSDERERFERAGSLPLDATLFPVGHPLRHQDADGADWLLFCNPFPAVRVPATTTAYLQPDRYQAWTCLKIGTRWPQQGFAADAEVPFDRDADGRLRWSWKASTAAVDGQRWAELVARGHAGADEGAWDLHDAATGERVLPHGGSLAWNEHRQRWVSVFLQAWGETMVGEVWYAEAEDPWGEWSPATKIVSHDDYSFYNVRHHPFFDQDGGRTIYFEGTYTATFSGNDSPTPRYDYNQVMYRLDVSEPRLFSRGSGPSEG